jgi:hypothetical protein
MSNLFSNTEPLSSLQDQLGYLAVGYGLRKIRRKLSDNATAPGIMGPSGGKQQGP